jgi:meso-butanediol dehydrogenase/(S,S)-butanediol dehydrogenase/diacetyl reductase
VSGCRRFEGKVVVVLGGNSGIGIAAAERLQAEGATVVIAARRVDEGEAAVARLGGSAWFARVDVRERDQIAAMFDSVVARHGRLDVLVNSAGASVVQRVEEIEPRHWQRTLDVNLTGVFNCCQLAVPHLRSTITAGLARQTSIVNVGSIDSIASDKGFAAYSAAKAGVLNFSRSLGMELAAEGIRVNTVSPGIIATPMADFVTSNPAIAERYHSVIPIGRLGLPEEIAGAIAFVASDDASFMIASNLVVDGGVTAGTGHPDFFTLPIG